MHLARTQLERAHICRVTQSWDLYDCSEWLSFSENAFDLKALKEGGGLFLSSMDNFKRQKALRKLSLSKMSPGSFEKFYYKLMDKQFPGVKELVERFQGKLALCGGFFSAPFYTSDVDLFFYNCTPEEAQEIIEEACRMLPNFLRAKIEEAGEDFENHYHHLRGISLDFNRCQDTSNIYYRHPAFRWSNERKIQFIHRIYPSLAHIVGGFDVQASMIAFDGSKIVANCMGAWAFVNSTIVVDVSRCSTSFAHRIGKYRRRGHNIIFPGFDYRRRAELIDDVVNKIDHVKAQIQSLIKENGLRFLLWESDYGGPGKRNGAFEVPKLESIKEQKPVEIMHGMWLNLKKDNPGNVASKGCPPQAPDYGSMEAGSFYASDKESVAECNLVCLIKGNLKCFCTQMVSLKCDRSSKWSVIKDGLLLCNEEEYQEAVDELLSCHYFHRTQNLVYLLGGYQNIPASLTKESIIKDQNIDVESLHPFDLENRLMDYRRDNTTEIRTLMISRLQTNLKDFNESLSEMTWMTQNPQLQWSSTIHPELLTAQEFYKGAWNGFTIFDWKIVRLFLISRYEPGSAFFGMPKDVLRMILWKVPFVVKKVEKEN